ncbi:hypothetical protein CTI12_AA111730 [Artemisia annua]|uniref:Uncharacterized protein n=1 Tax=Artemisia annua TaxID=35608 RepID=A0A2U1PUC1_ARTAN|nr:hypothetical protein CTI12_AA111730 [Artemisia annua]
MVRASENVKVKEGGGVGTIRIGATGKVSALMMQELDTNVKPSSKKICVETRKMQTAPVSVDCGGSKKRLKRMMSLNRSGPSNAPDQTRPEKKKNTRKGSQKIPMLDSEDSWMDKTPIRGKEHKKVTQRIVETVDLTCGKNDGDWSIIPIGNQLRRLSFSKI